MWQEIITAVIVILAALYIVRRNWKKFKAGKGEGLDCPGDCGSCNESAGCPQLGQGSILKGVSAHDFKSYQKLK